MKIITRPVQYSRNPLDSIKLSFILDDRQTIWIRPVSPEHRPGRAKEEREMDRNETIKRIKTALQKRTGMTWSVTGGRGTASGIRTPSKRTLNNCMDNNPDGAGYMFPDGIAVHISKGFHSAKHLLRDMRLELKQRHLDELQTLVIFHARTGTSGLKKPENTHPFPLSSSVADLQALKIDSPTGMAHNGILCHVEGNLSDTMIFIRDYLCNWTFDELEQKRTRDLIQLAIGSDKMVIIDRSGKLIQWGSWIEDDGISWSNRTFERSRLMDYFTYWQGNTTKRIYYADTTEPDEVEETEDPDAPVSAYGPCEYCDKSKPLTYNAPYGAYLCRECTDYLFPRESG
jgi:hypothetical protein